MVKKYRLFALPLNNENIEAASKARFSRATPSPEPGYVLIYTDGAKPKQATEITADKTELLSQADVRWLLDSNAALVAEEIEKNRPEIIRGLSERVETLEEELKRKKAELIERGE